MSDAVQDLVFLSKRLKGILELSDVLTTREALANQTKEFENSLEALKTLKKKKEEEVEKLGDYILETSNAIEEHVKEGKDTYNIIVEKAKVVSSEIITKAQEEANTLIENSKRSLSFVEDKINEKTKYLEELNKNVNVANDKLNYVNKQIETLKSKF